MFCIEIRSTRSLDLSPKKSERLEMIPVGQKMPVLDNIEDTFLSSGTLARYLGLEYVNAFTIPITIHLVFIGFDGDGRSSVDISSKAIAKWFDHLENSRNHGYVSLLNRMVSFSDFCKYKFDFKVVKLSPLVNTVVETILTQHVRPEIPRDDWNEAKNPTDLGEDEVFYVDAAKMTALLTDLMEHVGLGKNKAFTLFIMSPHSPVGPLQKYGYRIGFSLDEMKRIFQNPNISTSPVSEAIKWTDDIFLPDQRQQKEKDKGKDKEKEKEKEKEKNTGVNEEIKVIDFTKESDEWCWHLIDSIIKNTDDALSRGDLVSKCNKARELGVQDDEEADEMCIHAVLKTPRKNILDLAHEFTTKGTYHERMYLRKIHTVPFDGQECLTDAWIGHQRFAFIDLTAGPFSWGKVSGGTGSRTYDSIPRMPSLREIHSHIFASYPISNHDAILDEEEILKAIFDEYDSISLSESSSGKKLVKLNQALEVLINLYTDFCININEKDPNYRGVDYCRNLEVRQNGIHSQINDINTRNQERRSPLSSVFSGLLGNFMADLGSVVSKTIRHVVVPPSSMDFRDTPSERVIFRVYFVKGHEDSYDPFGEFAFSYEAFKREVLSLKLPEQEFRFILQELKLFDSEILSLAFESSLKKAKVEDFDADFLYLDTSVLEGALESFSDDTKLRNVPVGAGKFQTVSVLIFSVDGDIPVFLDNGFQARALENVVVAIQNKQMNYPGRYICNDNIITLDLRNPTRPLLASIAFFLYGALPTHVMCHEADDEVSYDWLWSVGDSVLSSLSGSSGIHWHFSQPNRESIWTTLSINSLSESLQKLNRGIQFLDKTSASELSIRCLMKKSSQDLIHDSGKSYARIIFHLEKILLNLEANFFDNQISDLKLFDDLCSKYSLSLSLFLFL